MAPAMTVHCDVSRAADSKDSEIPAPELPGEDAAATAGVGAGCGPVGYGVRGGTRLHKAGIYVTATTPPRVLESHAFLRTWRICVRGLATARPAHKLSK